MLVVLPAKAKGVLLSPKHTTTVHTHETTTATKKVPFLFQVYFFLPNYVIRSGNAKNAGLVAQSECNIWYASSSSSSVVVLVVIVVVVVVIVT